MDRQEKRDVYRRLIGGKSWATLAKSSKAKAGYECAWCGRVTQTCEVHHVVDVRRGRDCEEMERLCFDPSNLVVLCRQCHHDYHNRQRVEGKASGKYHSGGESSSKFIEKFVFAKQGTGA